MAIYSAGAGNQYGHPQAEVIARLTDAGIAIYGTSTDGTVSVTTNGRTYTVASGTARASAPTSAPAPPPQATPAPPPIPPPADSSCQPSQVDINSAGFDELQRIIHIGPDRAGQIPDLRPFSSVDAMERISGIGPARLADIKAQGVACAG